MKKLKKTATGIQLDVDIIGDQNNSPTKEELRAISDFIKKLKESRGRKSRTKTRGKLAVPKA